MDNSQCAIHNCREELCSSVELKARCFEGPSYTVSLRMTEGQCYSEGSEGSRT